MTATRVSACLWCDNNADEAAAHYLNVFPDSRELGRQYYGPMSPMPEGTLLTVELELCGQRFVLLNGGPQFKFSEAVSFELLVEDQAETDRLWAALTDGGEEGPCGWLKDRFGLSWQVAPRECIELLSDPDPDRRARASSAMFRMKKLDVATMRAAADDADYEVRPWNE